MNTVNTSLVERATVSYYVGVDVGTGSVRSAVVSHQGQIVAAVTKEIKIWSPKPDYYQQSSQNIWSAVTETIKSAIAKSGVRKEDVHIGIGFDATCSLVVLDKGGNPVSVCDTGAPDQDIVMWMDHRAQEQTSRINATNHHVLKFVGGTMSLEMQPPKLMWLKENLPESWEKIAMLFDLPDYLTWKATGSTSRSLCSLVCKWTYQADRQGNKGWDHSFWNSIGLPELLQDGYNKIGSDVRPPGTPCGEGLTNQIAEELGLLPGTAVGSSLIDAHAGALGCLGCRPEGDNFSLPDITSRLTLVCGTSTCHMIGNNEPVFVPGVWGPYYSAIVPGLYFSEGGQSATGKLIDFVVETHPAYTELQRLAAERGIHVHDVLNSVLEQEAERRQLSSVCLLTENFHIWPDFHGNRSPLADSTLRGMKCGLSLAADVSDLAVQYLATVQALSYATRHVMDEMIKSGHKIGVMYVCGGLRKNKLYIKTQVDVTGLPVIMPREEESVLVGAAILGASASGDFNSLQEAMEQMGGRGTTVLPSTKDKKFHDKKYKVFLKMVEHQNEYKAIMNQ